jgi:hypothetical protein
MEVKTTLNEEMARRFKRVKEHTGLKEDKNVIGFLISEEYGRIESANKRRVFVPNATYRRLEETAAAHHQTIEEFVNGIIEENTKQGAKEGSSHAD